MLRRTTLIAAAGLVVGLGGAAALVRTLESRLVGVQASDPFTWSLAATGLVLVAVLASLVPVRQATRVDVTETLRDV